MPTTPDDGARPSSRMTLGVYLLRADGTRVTLRPTAVVEAAPDWAPDTSGAFPACACPRHTAQDGGR